MYTFPKGLYADVRIEKIFETRITYTLGELEESKVRRYKAAFIRVFDGKRWYFASTSDVDAIQSEIDRLSKMASHDSHIDQNSIVKAFEVNQGNHLKFDQASVCKVDKKEKAALLQDFFDLLKKRPMLKIWKANYIDAYKEITFLSSKGTNITFDTQRAGFVVSLSFANGDKKLNERFQRAADHFDALKGYKDELEAYLDTCEAFLLNAQPVTAGKYTVVLSPVAAGVFAHESFGHKSESDFMVGDETMKREWAIGKKVGSDILTIADSGSLSGSGYTPFDDEGTSSKTTYLIKDGVLTGRLHSATTASLLEEGLTGNARAMNFEFEPIVRMTTTYILPGTLTKEQLIEGVEDGFYIDTIKHGSGMSTFTIAPSLAYRIQNGKIAEPVNISVLTGTVFETLQNIDGLSDTLELKSFVSGGCGKMEQYPLPVGFGGPYVRIRNMNIS